MTVKHWTIKEWSTGEAADVARHLNEVGATDDQMLYALFNALNRIARLEKLLLEIIPPFKEVEGGP